MKRIVTVVLVVGLLAVGGIAWYAKGRATGSGGFRTTEVKRGDLVATIGATGTVEPEEVVDVGAQVAGQILAFGKDVDGKAIDYGSRVAEGTILARIDDSVYASDVASATAQLQEAKASVSRAIADLAQFNAKFVQAQSDWTRAQTLDPKSNAIAATQYDAYKSAFDSARANVAVGEAAIEQAKATVAQNEAALARAQRNLGYTTIKSPVKGVIIDRRVNIGQTVVASLNAPSLFLIAKDLGRMQVWVAVNEADIGSIHPGQAVSFTVDAYPGQNFRGAVNKVRLNASMTQNVVTYVVEVTTDNKDGRLLPYLTANVQFEIARRDDVMTVPNAALRWAPSDDAQISPSARGQQSQQQQASSERRPRGERTERSSTRPTDERKPGTVWVTDGEYVRPIPVIAGLSDGTNTEVHSDQLSEGMQVVLGEERAQTASSGSSTSSNPFAPQMGRGPGGGGRGRTRTP